MFEALPEVPEPKRFVIFFILETPIYSLESD
jgi:hypothetical protein